MSPKKLMLTNKIFRQAERCDKCVGKKLRFLKKKF